MKPHPKTDIVVLTLNACPITRTFFTSLKKNTIDYNLYFVDNGSTDDTLAFLKSLKEKESNITVIENGENRGVAGGRNVGISAGNAEYVICLDNDQFVFGDWLSPLFNIVERFDIAGCDAWQMTLPSDKRPYFPSKHCESKNDPFTYVGGGGTLIPRKVFDKVGLYDEQFNPIYYEDSDFYFRVYKAGFRAAWNYKHKIKHVGHQTIGKFNAAMRVENFNRSYNLFVKKWHPFIPRTTFMGDLEKLVDLE